MRIVFGIGNEQDTGPMASFLSVVPVSTQILAVAIIPKRNLLDSMSPYPWRLRRSHRLLKEAAELERKHASDLLDNFRSSVSNAGAVIQTTVVTGNPARQLVGIAQREEADLIVVARQHSIRTSSLGHIASRIARYAKCSVLVLNPDNPVPRVCLLASDGSSQATTAGSRLRSLVVRGRRTLHICAVAPSFNATFVKTGSLAYTQYNRVLADIRENQTAAARMIVDRESVAFRESQFDVRKLVYTGGAVAILSKVIQEHNVDLVVMGAKGLSAPSRFFLGSVTWRLLNRVTCSILIGR